MHHEGGHAIEGVELASFEQRLGGLHLRHEAGGLPAGGLEQVAHFPVQLDRRAGAQQRHEPEQLVAHHQRHHQPQVGVGQQPQRQGQLAVDAW